MRTNRKWSALRLKKQYIHSQFEEAPRVRYRACGVVHDWLDQWDSPRWYKRKWYKPNCWKKQRKTQYKVKNHLPSN